MRKAYASLYRGSKFLGSPVSTSGELILESDSLRFIPSRLHPNAEVIDLRLLEIELLETERIKLGFGLGVDGLRLICGGESYLFGVRNASEWLGMIRQGMGEGKAIPAQAEASMPKEMAAAPLITESAVEERHVESELAPPPSA